ncbi:hypothetical protein IMSAGC013_01410 [Lachnospiraceae bacterium]|jgi:hypothetical protein|nr:hypothetical protein IMSAGC013_01410 [Lachnospiraceae bacterium]
MDEMKNEKTYTVNFPVRMLANTNGFNFINSIYYEINNRKYEEITFDFQLTNIFETNLIAFLGYAIEKIYSNQIIFELKIGQERYLCEDQSIVLRKIFEFYSLDKSPALLPRKIGNRNLAEEEQLLLRDLKELELNEYNKIRTILSELMANLKMHTIYLDGYFAGYHDYKNHQILFSIVNYDITFANHIKQANKMEFENDFEAIVWALKKNNTTRQDSGGIGLYILRKYISDMNGKFSVLSGNSYVECDKMCYNEENENLIRVSKRKNLSQRFEGTTITLYIPDHKGNLMDEKKVLEEICLRCLLEV